MDGETKIKLELKSLHIVRNLITLACTQEEADNYRCIADDIETRLVPAVRMLGKTVTGEKLQAVLDGDNVTLLPVVKEG